MLNSPAGQAEGYFQVPFDPRALQIFVLKVGRPRRGVRHHGSDEMKMARDFGRKLFDAVFTGQVLACYLRGLDEAEKSHQGLRIRMRATHAPALIDLPWEYLYDSTHKRFLSHSAQTPIVRLLDLPRRIEPLSVPTPLHVLVMITNPQDVVELDVEQEWAKLQKAVSGLQAQGLLRLTRVPGGTLSALQKQLRRDSYHVFHYIGHGVFDEQSQQGMLVMENDNGQHRKVGGDYLGTLLRDHPSLRLALLNACEGGRTSPSDPYAGVAQHLV